MTNSSLSFVFLLECVAKSLLCHKSPIPRTLWNSPFLFSEKNASQYSIPLTNDHYLFSASNFVEAPKKEEEKAEEAPQA